MRKVRGRTRRTARQGANHQSDLPKKIARPNERLNDELINSDSRLKGITRGVPTLAALPRGRMALLSLALAAVALLLYYSTLAHPFADYDDDNYVTANPEVQKGLTSQSLLWAVTATEKSNWHPLTWISHETDFQLYGMNPLGHHLTSIVLHAINAILLFIALSVATREPLRSFAVSLLFVVHPLNVESVVWIAERKNVLSTAFFLAAIALYVQYVRKPSASRYLALVVVFALGLASKPMVITLPCVLLLMDYWPLQRWSGQTEPGPFIPGNQQSWSRLWLEKIPLFVLCAVSAKLTLYAQRLGGSVKSLSDLPLGVRFQTAIWAYGEYLWKIFWPAALAPHYPHPSNTLAWWRVVLSLALILSLSALAWIQRSRPYLLVGWCWFLGTLVPVIGLIQVGNQAVADRYVYLPMIGLLIALVWCGADLLQRTIHGPLVASIALPILIVGLCWQTHDQIGFWKNSAALWSHTLEVTKNNALAENNLGVALMGLGREADGISHFRNAERIDPSDPTSRLNIAVALQEQGRLQDAVREYMSVIQLASANAAATANSKMLAVSYADLGTAYAQAGDYQTARQFHQKALAINPLALNILIEKSYRVFHYQPSADNYTLLGEMLEESGREEEAQAAYRQALNINPTQSEALRSIERLRQHIH